ncbi:MAG: S8 family serine peptidase [Rhodothermales bacterium]
MGKPVWPINGLAATIFAVAAFGCSDNLAAIEQDASVVVDAPQTVNESTKFRHEKYVRREMRKRMGKDGEEVYLGLIVQTKGSMQAQKVLERLKVLERYKVLERESYENVFDGVAIEVIDNFGVGDYSTLFLSLVADPDVVWFEPDITVQVPASSASVTSEGQRVPWSVAAVGGEESWAVSGDGWGAVDADVYVLDTGVSNDDINVVEALNFTPNSGNPDVDGHGTHIAGIIGAKDDASGIVGIAPGVRIHDFKVLGDDGTAPTSVVLSAVEELVTRKKERPGDPMIINMSLGENVSTSNETALDEAVEAAVDAGIVVIASAGNWGVDVRDITPARAKGVIAVGSYAMDGRFSGFSNYGSGVDLLAPGEGIVSLSPNSSVLATMSGTSMAAAHVSGAAALYLAKNRSATVAKVEAWLRGSARDQVVGAPSQTTRKSVWVGPADVKPGLMFVVSNPSYLDYQDALKKQAFESWGYSVTVMAASASFEALTSGADASSVIYISEDVNATELGTKLSNVTTGIVTEEGALSDELGLAQQGYYIYNSGSLRVRDSSHEITDGLSSYSDVSSAQNVIFFKGIASEVQSLASWGWYDTMLVLDKGKRRLDGSPSPGRRAIMPLGPDNFEFSRLHETGTEMWRSALKWAAE